MQHNIPKPNQHIYFTPRPKRESVTSANIIDACYSLLHSGHGR